MLGLQAQPGELDEYDAEGCGQSGVAQHVPSLDVSSHATSLGEDDRPQMQEFAPVPEPVVPGPHEIPKLESWTVTVDVQA